MSVAVPSGLIDPMAGTPPRPGRSVRRTSHVDIAPTPDGGLALAGSARDLRTGADRSEVLAEVAMEAELDAFRQLKSVRTSPGDDRLDALVGLTVARGFRAAVDAAIPDDRAAASPRYLLLDELPVAAVISGYAMLYSGTLDSVRIDTGHVQSDICSGWRSDGTMMVSLRTNGRMPIPVGPPAPDLETADDPLAWHPIGRLPSGAMRRRRLVEVTAGAPHAVYAMFRDTHVDADGTETVLHEYSVTAWLDPATLTLSECRAEPRVLPWVECPSAAASASRLDGMAAPELRRFVSRELRGTSTCTHLNDLLRSLGDLGALAAHLG